MVLPDTNWLLSAAIVAIALGAWALSSAAPEFHYAFVQEDGALEWATFWAFLGAAVVAGRTLFAPGQTPLGVLYVGGFALGCLLIALEEISWGQRVFAYRPPTSFLTDNYQQEFNVHNIVATNTRKLVLHTLLLGFGVVLPVLGRVPALASLARRLGVPLPPLAIVPAFAGASLVYWLYPWRSAGEWVELMAGLGFVVASIDLLVKRGLDVPPTRAAALFAAPLLLGYVSQFLIAPSPESAIVRTEREVEALAQDIREGRLRPRCGLHKRLFTFVQQFGSTRFEQGAFVRDAARSGAEPDRIAHLLDPWNLAYWVRYNCSREREVLFVYSFGPNRRRDSGRWSLEGDDIGRYLVRRPRQ